MGNVAVPTLMMVTLVIVLILGVMLLLRHLRKPENRHPMDGQPERNIDEIRRDGPDGTNPRA